MLLRIVAENIASFKQAVEFNTFPASKSHSHDNHKIACGHATALRLAAIYGANGAGPLIGPDTALIFDVQLIEIMK